jgi:glycosyltransferase involved in cell wall biosynthesis
LAKPEKEFHITFVGRLEPRKGIDLLLQVAPDLLREFPQAVLNIVGKDVGAGPGHSYEKEFTKKNKELISRGRIRFLGEVSEDELDGHYRNAEIVVAPSRYESFGLVHLESQMYGKAVIGSRIGGMQEIIKHGETGFLIKPGDSRDLYETLKSCIDGVQNIELIGIQARQNFLERHGKNRVVSDVRSILLSALGAVPN